MNGAGVAIARFIRLPGSSDATAEAAITVADEYQRKGLGKLLLSRLCAAAKQRGIGIDSAARCSARTRSMRTLIEQIAPDRTVEVGGGVMSIDIALPTEPTKDSGIYHLFRAAAANAVEWTAAVRRLWRR